jgi:hypothetical protein
MRILPFFVVTFLSAALHAQVTTRTLGFDPPHVESNGRGTGFRPSVREQGFVLTRPVADYYGGMYVQPHLYLSSPANGTNYARFISGDQNFTLRHEQNLAFTAVSLDIAGASGGAPASLRIQGTKVGGVLVNTTVPMPPLGDGAGPLADFATVTLPASFADITELKILDSYYYLDNLVVIPPVGESLATPLSLPDVYDITWEGEPHTVGQITATGGGRSPSNVNFGYPKVRNGIGAMTGRALELVSTAGYGQIEMSLGLWATRYVLDFDFCHLSGGSMALFLDSTKGFLRTDLSGGSVSYYNGSDGVLTGSPSSGAAYTANAVTHGRMEWDSAAGTVRLLINNTLKATWSMTPGTEIDLSGIRFSTASTSVTGLDNVKIQAFGGPAIRVVPGSFAFQSIQVNTTRTAPITVMNPSSSAVTVTRAEVSGSAFQFTGITFPVVIPAGGKMTGTVSARPTIIGNAGGSVRFVTDAGSAVTVTGVHGTGAPLPAYFSTHPSSRWVTLGSGTSLYATIVGAVSRFEWTKDDVVIPGATDSHFLTPALTLADAGVYRIKAYLPGGTVITSNPAHVGVIQSQSLASTRDAGGTLELSTTVAAPGLTYAWKQNDSALPGTVADVVVNGGQLRLSPIRFEHEGVITCDVTMTNGAGGNPLGFRAMTYNLTVPQPPRITTASLGHAQVGQNFQMTLAKNSTKPVNGFEATGLPPGMIIFAATGIIAGAPLPESIPNGNPPGQAVLYTVRVSAANQYGRGPEAELPLWVHEPSRSSRFVGLTGGGVPNGREGRWQATMTSGGQVTALIDSGALRVSVAGTLNFDTLSGDMKGRLVGGVSLFDVRLRNGRVLELDAVYPALIALQAGICVERLNPAQQQPGLYPTALMAAGTVNYSDYPYGASLIMARLGPGPRMTCAGVMADGSTVTSSGELVHDWVDTTKVRYPFCLSTANGLGLVQGWLIAGGGLMDGHLLWVQSPSPLSPSYPEGFRMNSPSLYLQAFGSLHIPPGTGTTLLNLHTQPQRVSASHDFGISSSLNRLFSIDTRHRATPLAPGDRQASLTINPADSSFSGSLEVDTYRGKPLMAKYRGLLVPRLGQGVGFLLHPKMELYEENLRNRRGGILIPFESFAVDLKPDVTK